jgi:hypothetical protein
MSGLREAFDEIVADVPVYGDLDRAIEQAERERRRRYGVVAGLAAAAAVVAVVVGMLTLTRDTDTAPPVLPRPSPTPTKTQGPDTWVDTAMTPTKGSGSGVLNPLDAVRDGWFQIAADHLRPSPRSYAWPGTFELPREGTDFSTTGQISVMDASRVAGLLADGCAHLHPTPGDHRKESCSTEQIEGPNGEPVHVTSFQSLCTTWDADSAAPGVYYRNCGDYDVTVVAERGDGRIGYIDVQGRDYVEAMPFALADLAAAAVDPRLTLPDSAYEVPSDQAVASILADHVPGYLPDDAELVSPLARQPGDAHADGKLGRLGLSVSVVPAGGAPTCGRAALIECFERRVFGADDPTTVYVRARWVTDWGCCTLNHREFVYVGPRNTVVVLESAYARADEEPISADLDQTLIDFALDPRLQADHS